MLNLCVHTFSVMSYSLQPPGLFPPRLLCPWNFSGKLTGCYFLLYGNLPNSGVKPDLFHLLPWRADSLPLLHLGSWLLPWVYVICKQSLVNDFIHLWNHCIHRVYILIRYNFGENWDHLCEMKHFLKINYGIYVCSAYATNKRD